MKFKNLRERLGCNQPRRTPGERKKFVVKACENGQQKIVRFGDPVLKIKKNIPSRKKSYCARSGGIKGGKGKLSANFWSRKAWEC